MVQFLQAIQIESEDSEGGPEGEMKMLAECQQMTRSRDRAGAFKIREQMRAQRGFGVFCGPPCDYRAVIVRKKLK
jgi:hypothetical protein